MGWAASVIGEALAPLAARYGYWLGLDEQQVLADRDEAQQDIRALQLILRMEREDQPSWHAALALAATGAAAVCLDPRAEPGGEWYQAVYTYCVGHIRKVTRRGRGAQWEAATALPGIGLRTGSTEIRALVPGLTSELDKRISKLQVGGTDVPPDEPLPKPAGAALTIWIPPEPVMTLGKAMAQAGHAGMIAGALLAGNDQPALRRWIDAGLPAWAARAGQATWADLLTEIADPERAWQESRLLAVRDAGFTEIAPGTVTVIAQAP